MKVRVFGKRDCDACKAALNKIEYFARKWGKAEVTEIQFFDMETPDGLADGAWYDVYDVPTVILDQDGRELARWVKQVPLSREFKKYFFEETAHEGSGDQGLC